MYDTIQPMRPLTAAQIQRNLLAALILRESASVMVDAQHGADEEAA